MNAGRLWQWLETRGHPLGALTCASIDVSVHWTVGLWDASAQGTGVPWPAALCRAALALAEALGRSDEQGARAGVE